MLDRHSSVLDKLLGNLRKDKNFLIYQDSVLKYFSMMFGNINHYKLLILSRKPNQVADKIDINELYVFLMRLGAEAITLQVPLFIKLDVFLRQLEQLI